MGGLVKLGEVRIIGGKWRGRKLSVLNSPGLRPTPDRVRETLFNWLAPEIHGAYCLDMFAGSGVIGFEALSRGASFVVMTDVSSAIVKHLQQELIRFKATDAEIYQAKAPAGIKQPAQLFNMVILDPPFDRDLLLPSCFYLEKSRFLAKNALIYLETNEPLSLENLPSEWQVLKNKQAGQVFYYLARRNNE
jgi:16S rRNA (guanine966-N2)-methyltransferase